MSPVRHCRLIFFTVKTFPENQMANNRHHCFKRAGKGCITPVDVKSQVSVVGQKNVVIFAKQFTERRSDHIFLLPIEHSLVLTEQLKKQIKRS